MSVRTLDPGPQPLLSSPSHAAVRCPDCGGARRVTTDGLTGLLREECDECDRKAARAKLRAQFDVAALARVAERFGLTVEVVTERLSGIAASNRKSVTGHCKYRSCGVAVVRKGTWGGRAPEYCETHRLVTKRARSLAAYHAKRGGPIREEQDSPVNLVKRRRCHKPFCTQPVIEREPGSRATPNYCVAHMQAKPKAKPCKV